MMYADFEANLKPIQATNPKPTLNKHISSGFCIYSKFIYGKVKNPFKLYRGEDCVEVFCDYSSNEAKRLYHMFPEKSMKPLTREQWRKHNRATACHICLKGFKEDDIRVRDHCHYTGKYQGPAHRSCNLRYRIPKYIPIVFHNLSGYVMPICSSESQEKNSIQAR